MELVNLLLPGTNKFAGCYYKGTDEVKPFFHYSYQESTDYIKRLEELRNRPFKRKELAEHISQFMKPFPTSDKVKESIEKLKNENSVVVIGGQQAGLLTGPLYSINKVISIILLAKQKEEDLGIPVVPIFWIAGEDHDFAEVNHIYQQGNQIIEKWVYPEKAHNLKKMISDYELDKQLCKNWVYEIVEALGETQYSKELLLLLEESINRSQTFVDFFAFMIMELFKDDGLLLVDSGNIGLRELEKEIFIGQIKKSKEITEAVISQQREIVDNGFNLTIDISPQAANLFYYDQEHKERLLLDHAVHSRDYTANDGQLRLSYEEMLRMAENTPHFLSNNVVTRPITQDLLFPTLAFIAGPGEIAYWAELKKAFEVFGIKMPPIVPRISITFLEREIESDLKELALDLHKVLEKGVAEERTNYIESIKDKAFTEIFSQLRDSVNAHYGEIEKKIVTELKGLLPMLAKNQRLVQEQLAFMEGKIEEAILLKHDVRLRKFDRIESSLRPMNGPQERVWNILYFLNRYGVHFLEGISTLDLSFDGKHKVIKL